MKIAVVGATGMVGREVVKIILDKKITDTDNITLFASRSSAGKIIKYGDFELIVTELSKKNIKKYDFAIFCAGKSVALEYAKIFAKKGAVVVDNSSAFRRVKDIPLVVPEVNIDSIKNASIIANPNCSTIGVSLPLFCLSKLYPIKRVIVSTYQAVSGAGKKGVDDLKNNTTLKFEHGINNNLLPQIDIALNNGYTFEEDKMSFELKKILQNRYLKISATCVRVPIENCHSESVNIEFEYEPNIRKIKQALKDFGGICLVDDLKKQLYPMPKIADGKDDVFVGRIRRDTSNKNAVNFFISFDNLRKGAALNAVQIVEWLANHS